MKKNILLCAVLIIVCMVAIETYVQNRIDKKEAAETPLKIFLVQQSLEINNSSDSVLADTFNKDSDDKDNAGRMRTGTAPNISTQKEQRTLATKKQRYGAMDSLNSEGSGVHNVQKDSLTASSKDARQKEHDTSSEAEQTIALLDNKNATDVLDSVLRDLDWSMELKSNSETKIIGYVAVITLILTLVFQYLFTIEKLDIKKRTKQLLLNFYVFQFSLGLVVLLFCAIAIRPQPIYYINAQSSLERKISSADEMQMVEAIIDKNSGILKEVEKDSLRISTGMIVLIFMFCIGSVIFVFLMSKKLSGE